MWRLFGYSFLLILILFIVGCGQSGTSSGGKVFRYAITTEPTTFDPALVEDGPTIDLLFQVFEGLVRWEEDNKLVPNLAEKWEISDDGRVYTFTLKKGVRFHNGREVTAEDFKYSIERSLNKETYSTVAGIYLNDILGSKEYTEGRADTVSGVEVVDPYTLRITINASKGYFLAKLTYPTAYVVCKEEVAKNGGKINEQSMIGTGPFRLKEYLPNQKVILQAFDDYHGGRPKLDYMERPIILDATTRHSMYERGELDLVDVQKGDLERDRKDPVLSKELRFFDRAAIYYLALNQDAYTPFKDKRVRQAFALAIDREEVVRVALLNVNKKADGILPPGIPGYDPDFKGWEFNPAKARDLLSAAGYPNGKGMPALSLTFREKTPDLRRVSEVCADMLKQHLGVQVDLREMEWGAFLSARSKGTMAFYHLRWAADYIDAQNFLSLMLHTDTPENTLGYHNAEFDRLCDEADSSTDEQVRIRLYRQAERVAVEDAPWIPIYFQRDIELIKPYVKGIKDTLMGHLPHVMTDIEK